MLANVINRIKSMEYQRAFTVTDCNFGFGGHSREILKLFPKAYMYLSMNKEKDMIWIRRSLNTIVCIMTIC